MPYFTQASGMTMLLAVLAAGCSVGPDYVKPEVPISDAWQSAVSAEMNHDETPLVTWWEAFGDTALVALIRAAEQENLTLKIAVARVREARALRGIAKGGYLPNVNLGGSYTRFRISENSLNGQLTEQSGGQVEAQGEWDLSLDAFWEIDVWGRVRRQVESSTAQFEASVEDFRDVLVTLYAEVAANYIDLRTFQSRLTFGRQNAEDQRRTVQLTRDRFDAGLVSRLDVTQAETQLASTEAEIPRLESSANVALNRLAVLLGRQPGVLHDDLGVAAPIPEAPERVATGMPAELLRRRPDVRRAERQLAAQNAQIGVAKADLYPSFSLSGILGLVAGGGASLISGESVSWSLIPGVRWNVFNGGKVRNNIRVQEARTEQLLYAYEQSVLLALEEVEGVMVAYQLEKVRRDRLAEAVTAAARSVEIVRTQYLSGLTDFQRYLDSQRALTQQQDLLASSQGQVIRNLIALNKALGGGWPTAEEDPELFSSSEPGGDGSR
jgi:NodT family efflux transporter outer membrane factor (OMF) lipoprotein